ncbi:polyribonucleotide nucleotidyltransferase, partial [Candidatus Dependentiae bacterium]|nr:polyribonucleotide nucleotidyltransferase [Candidatus Dependentiae bacterium]
IINPDFLTLKDSDFQIFVAGTQSGITMIECEGNNANKQDIITATDIAQKNIIKLIDIQQEFISKTTIKNKIYVDNNLENEDLYKNLNEKIKTDYNKLLYSNDGITFYNNVSDYIKNLKSEYLSLNEKNVLLNKILKKIKYSLFRKYISETGKRLDNRNYTQLRDIFCERGLLPSAHGSALFTRGGTQCLAVTTIGSERKESNNKNSEKLFFLHYNFPGFSVGDCKKKSSISRREYGHGFLAEKSLKTIIPSSKDYNHNIRTVSEILESDGSSSMASVCGASISLKDAGVPISELAAGISIGLIKGNEKNILLTDINELEDHCGDMDFKIAGTKTGITGLQLDIKIQNIDLDIIEKTFNQAESNRLEILEKMEALF